MIRKFGVLLMVILLAGCSGEKKVELKGNLSGGGGQTLFLDHLGVGGMEHVDSVKIKANGNFTFKFPKSDYAEFYFIRKANGQNITVLIDSSEKVGVKANFDPLDDVVFEGSTASQRLYHFSKSITKERNAFQTYLRSYEAQADPIEKQNLARKYWEHLNSFKDSIGAELIKEPRSMVSYYVLFQKLNEEYYLFDVYHKKDYRYFATVATALNLFRPKDPRVKAFYEHTLQAFKAQRKEELAQRIKQAESGIPEIALPNLQGDSLRLSELKNKVVVLNFWASQSPDSRAWNRTLRSMHQKYQSRGMEIYQVSLDKSKVLWEKAMEDDKITWKSVWDMAGVQSKAAHWYNVRHLPTTFLIDRKGDIQARITSVSQLEKEIKAAL